MNGYGVHLLCHVLAVLAGGACGIAAGLWYFDNNGSALWLAGVALVVGVGVLLVQAMYLRRQPAADRIDRFASSGHRSPAATAETRRSGKTRPEVS